MRRPSVAIALALICALASLHAQQSNQTPPNAVPGEIIVQFSQAIGQSRREAILTSRGAKSLRRYDAVGLQRIGLPPGQTVVAAVAQFRSMPEVIAVRDLLAQYPDFATRLPSLAGPLAQPDPGFSYTQWEAYLALYHRRPVFTYRPTDFELADCRCPREARFIHDPAQEKAQQAHYRRICDLGHDRGEFLNSERLSSAVLRDLVEILPRLEIRLDIPPTRLRHTAVDEVLGRRPAFRDALQPYGEILAAWSRWPAAGVPRLGWTVAECRERWGRGVPLLAETTPPLDADAVEPLLAPGLDLLAMVGVS